MADNIADRLSALEPQIIELLSTSGTERLSLGVIHQNKIVHTANYIHPLLHMNFMGPPDLPNEETVYPIGSLTMGLVAAVVGMLVDEGKLAWNIPIVTYVPEFRSHPSWRPQVTLTDLLAHRSGVPRGNFWLGVNNNILVRKDNSNAMIPSLLAVVRSSERFQYSDYGYEIVGQVIKKVTGQSWAQHLEARVFQPLGLSRTGTSALHLIHDTNRSGAYIGLSDGIPWKVEDVKLGHDTFMGAAGGVRSCISDLLVLYKSFLNAMDPMFLNRNPSPTPFKQVKSLITARALMPNPSPREVSSALGWCRTQLPGPMGATGMNFQLSLGRIPEIRSGFASHLALHHLGSSTGPSSAVCLFPEMQSGIIVLTNTFGLNDCADFVAQLLTETLFLVMNKHDFISLAKQATERHLAWYKKIGEAVERAREAGGPPRALREYEGRYVNTTETLTIDVMEIDGKLHMMFENLADETYELFHYQKDTWTWVSSRDQLAEMGRWTTVEAGYHLLEFGPSVNGPGSVQGGQTNSGHAIERLIWRFHENVPYEGMLFVKREGSHGRISNSD
ncbi:hypothetical protein AJ80_04072 [Polytolypa hystricis UAMH7299]|uniref:Beta-lactamase-related domain-containing protein n=1 Tax=Polytolypa hystricis (strain UAMH7299) TaxID=1447883 RepID=A0A2B7YE11_POLH7|nr:hypothetical protein AJ80_04072 [Polytolypa hystricis UAMH7299]